MDCLPLLQYNVRDGICLIMKMLLHSETTAIVQTSLIINSLVIENLINLKQTCILQTYLSPYVDWRCVQRFKND